MTLNRFMVHSHILYTILGYSRRWYMAPMLRFIWSFLGPIKGYIRDYMSPLKGLSRGYLGSLVLGSVVYLVLKVPERVAVVPVRRKSAASQTPSARPGQVLASSFSQVPRASKSPELRDASQIMYRDSNYGLGSIPQVRTFGRFGYRAPGTSHINSTKWSLHPTKRWVLVFMLWGTLG